VQQSFSVQRQCGVAGGDVQVCAA